MKRKAAFEDKMRTGQEKGAGVMSKGRQKRERQREKEREREKAIEEEKKWKPWNCLFCMKKIKGNRRECINHLWNDHAHSGDLISN